MQLSPRSRAFIAWCRRYISVTLVATVAVLIVVLFINDNSVMRTYEYRKEIGRLKEQIQAATDTTNYYHSLNASLETDAGTTERIVREQYHMQRPNEDVYIFE